MNRKKFLGKRTRAFAAASALFFAAGNEALALTFSGDLCYKFHITQRETGPVNETYTGKFHVKPLDASTCVVHSLDAVPDDHLWFATGTCRLGSPTIYMNLTATNVHIDDGVDTEIMQVRLASTTLNGTFRRVSNDYNPSTHTVDGSYSSGTLTKIACP